MRKTFAFGFCLVTCAAPLAAQAGQFQVGPRLGYVKYATKTGIRDDGFKSSSAVLGLDGLYGLTNNIGLGFRLDLSRPQTDGNYFPAEMTFKDTIQLFKISQPLTILEYFGKIEVGTGGSFNLFVNGSVGGYNITLDPQVADGLKNVKDMAFGLGGGLAIQAGGSTHVRLEVNSAIWQNFDRSALNPVSGRFNPVQFPQAIPAQAPFKGGVSNLQFSLAFSFAPGGER